MPQEQCKGRTNCNLKFAQFAQFRARIYIQADGPQSVTTTVASGTIAHRQDQCDPTECIDPAHVGGEVGGETCNQRISRDAAHGACLIDGVPLHGNLNEWHSDC